MSKTTKLRLSKKFCKGDLVVLGVNDYGHTHIKPVVLWGKGGDKRLTIQYLTLYRMRKELQKLRDKEEWYSITRPSFVYGDRIHKQNWMTRGKSIVWGQKMLKYHPDLLIDTWRETYYNFLEVASINQGTEVLFESSRQ